MHSGLNLRIFVLFLGEAMKAKYILKVKRLKFMKKLMTMVSAMMMVAAVNASEVTTVAFNEARVNVPARVRFVKGKPRIP